MPTPPANTANNIPILPSGPWPLASLNPLPDRARLPSVGFADTPSSSATLIPAAEPLQPHTPWATKTLLTSVGICALTASIGWVLGKRTVGKPFSMSNIARPGKELANQAAKALPSPTIGPLAEQHTITTYRNIDSPLLTMAFLSQRPELRGVLGWFGLASVLGYIGGQALQGLQEAWVRAEETAIRMRGMDRMVESYQNSVRDRNLTLQQLKQQTWQTIQQWLGQQGLPQPEQFNPLLGMPYAGQPLPETDNSHMAWVRQRHTNYLLEPRTRPTVLFNGQKNPLTPNTEAAMGATLPLSAFSAAQWLPVLSGLAGGVSGLVARSLKQTLGQMNQLVARTTLSAGKNEAITGLFIKNTEALAVLAKQLEAPGLLLTYGLAVGLLRAGKLLVDGLREVAVTEENTQTELAYQQYVWNNLGTRLMAVAEGEWLKIQLAQLAKDLPQLSPHPTALYQRIASLVQGIGLNSAPPHYNTPLSLNITAARG